MPSADLLAEARAAFEAEQFEEAGGLFSALLQDEPDNPSAWGGLIRVLMALGQEDQAQDALAQVPPAIAEHAEVSGARSALQLAIRRPGRTVAIGGARGPHRGRPGRSSSPL